MKLYKGDIWNLYKKDFYVVIPTNIGWMKNGDNVMGAGLAAQAKSKFPRISGQYGWFCRSLIKHIRYVPPAFYHKERLILFPTKSLNKKEPHLSWQGKASIDLIDLSCELLDIALCCLGDNIKIAMPLVGCGNGGLRKKDVLHILKKYFDKNNNIVLVKYEKVVELNES